MQKITNTQYLKVGAETNVGKIEIIHDNQNFKTTDGFSHNLNEVSVTLIANKKHCRYCEVEILSDFVSGSSYDLCPVCDDSYDNQTGHCSLSCCISGECDETC